MMKGIMLSHGVAFVKYQDVTVRVNKDGSCELSPILYDTLEWDLRTEPPSTWSYITESDLDAQTRQRIDEVVREYRSMIED